MWRLAEHLCKEHIREQNEHRTAYNGICTGLSYLYRTAFNRVAEVRRHTGDDVGEEQTLDDTHPREPGVERMLYAKGEIVGGEDVPNVGRGVGSEDAHGRTEYHKKRHDGYQS